jgi:type 1 glutamine amidotransferase
MKHAATRILALATLCNLAATPSLAAPAADELPPAERAAIEKAIPAKAPAVPAKPRKLLVFDLNVNYGGHGSIRHANFAFRRMGEKTGAFETVVSRDPEVFRPESLRQFDAVFFNNTVGNLFEDAELRESLAEFVYSGGGLLGVHGTSVAFTRWPGAHEDWPEFGRMLGARGASHRASDEQVFIKLDDPGHPLTRPFGGGFDFRDEFFRVHEPYSRDRVRVLLSIDTEKTDLDQGTARGGVVREDGDYALAWVRGYGRGRVFYSTIAHNPYVFWDPRMLEFYLGAVQFALGDLPAPTTPSSRLTPVVRAREKLGWRPALATYGCRKLTLFEAVDMAAELGLSYLGAAGEQVVSKEIAKPFDGRLRRDELVQIRLKLDSAGVRLLGYGVADVPGDEAGCREVVSFARKMGIETLVCDPPPESLGTVKKLCAEHGLKLASRNDDDQQWLECSEDRPDATAEIARRIEALNERAIRLAE